MGRRLIERTLCETCGQRVETTADGVEHGHMGHGVAPDAPPAEEPQPVEEPA